MSVVLPQGYENKVLTGDKLYTLVSLIKQELGNKVTANDVLQAIDDYLLGNGIDVQDHEIDIELTLGDEGEEGVSSMLNADGLSVTHNMVGDYEANTSYTAQEMNFYYKDITDELHYGATYTGGGFILTVNEYDTQTNTLGNRIAEFQVDALDDGTIAMNAVDANTDPIPVLLNGEQLATIDGIISDLGGTPGTDTLADAIDDRIPDISGKQDALVFNTAYNASSNKVATMSDIPDISGKQDALVFNTAYNASSNKVATMADIPSVSGFQTASDVQTAITTAISGITSFSFEIVQALPVSNISQTTIYLVLKSSGSSGNIYTEYAYVKTGTDAQTGNDIYGWETLGDTQADIAVLSTAEVTAIWNYQPPADDDDGAEEEDDDNGIDPGL